MVKTAEPAGTLPLELVGTVNLAGGGSDGRRASSFGIVNSEAFVDEFSNVRAIHDYETQDC